MAKASVKHDGHEAEETSSEVFRAENVAARPYFDQFERVLERIEKHPSLDAQDKNTVFITMLEQVSSSINRNESNKEAPSLKYISGKKRYRPSPMSRELESIDKLLSAAQEMMKRAPGLDQHALEHIRQLRVKVRYAIASHSVEDSGEMPVIAPELYKSRAERGENPIEFIKRVYGAFLGKGISRPDIAKLDKNLYVSLNTWITRNGGTMPDIGLPTKSERIDQKLQENSGATVKPPSRTVKAEELSPIDREQIQLYRASQRRQRTPT